MGLGIFLNFNEKERFENWGGSRVVAWLAHRTSPVVGGTDAAHVTVSYYHRSTGLSLLIGRILLWALTFAVYIVAINLSCLLLCRQLNIIFNFLIFLAQFFLLLLGKVSDC